MDATDIQTKNEYLKKIYQKCKYNYWLHNKSYYYFYRLHVTLHIIIIVLNLAIAILNGSQVNNDKFNTIIRYTSTIVLLVNSFFVSLINLFKIDKKMEFHKGKTSEYTSLANEIEEYIIVGKPPDIITKLFKNYITLSSDNEFMVPESIVNQSKKQFSNKNIHKTISNATLIEYVEAMHKTQQRVNGEDEKNIFPSI